MSEPVFVATYDSDQVTSVVGVARTEDGAMELCQNLVNAWAEMGGTPTEKLVWAENLQPGNAIERVLESQDTLDAQFFVYARPMV